MDLAIKSPNFAWTVFGAITDEHSTLQQATNTRNSIDKIVKLMVAISDIIVTGLGVSRHAGTQAAEDFRDVNEYLFKSFRALTGLFNAFYAPVAIRKSVEKIICIVKMIRGHDLDDQIQMLDRAKDLKIDAEKGYATNAQRGLGIVAEGLNVVGSFATFGGFGICRPVQVLSKFITDMEKTQMGKSAKETGNAFGHFMFINHLATLGATSFHAIRFGLFYSTVKSEHQANKGQDSLIDAKMNAARQEAYKLIKQSLLTYFGVGCDLGVDIISLLKTFRNISAPIGVILTLNLIIACIDLYKAITESKLAAIDKIESLDAKRQLAAAQKAGVNWMKKAKVEPSKEQVL